MLFFIFSAWVCLLIELDGFSFFLSTLELLASKDDMMILGSGIVDKDLDIGVNDSPVSNYPLTERKQRYRLPN